MMRGCCTHSACSPGVAKPPFCWPHVHGRHRLLFPLIAACDCNLLVPWKCSNSGRRSSLAQPCQSRQPSSRRDGDHDCWPKP